MTIRTEQRPLPYGLKALLIIDDAQPRQSRPDRDIERSAHHEKCHCGKCPQKKVA